MVLLARLPLSCESVRKFASNGGKGGRGESTELTVANDEDSRERHETDEEFYPAEAGNGQECGKLSETRSET